MKKIFRKEVLIGLIVLVAMAVLIIGIDFLKGSMCLKPPTTIMYRLPTWPVWHRMPRYGKWFQGRTGARNSLRIR